MPGVSEAPKLHGSRDRVAKRLQAFYLVQAGNDSDEDAKYSVITLKFDGRRSYIG